MLKHTRCGGRYAVHYIGKLALKMRRGQSGGPANESLTRSQAPIESPARKAYVRFGADSSGSVAAGFNDGLYQAEAGDVSRRPLRSSGFWGCAGLPNHTKPK